MAPDTNHTLMLKDLATVLDKVNEHSRMVASQFHPVSGIAVRLAGVAARIDAARDEVVKMVHELTNVD